MVRKRGASLDKTPAFVILLERTGIQPKKYGEYKQNGYNG